MSDDEYEEILVFADFKNQLMPNELGDPKTVIKMIGLETDTPIVEINGNIFKGNYDYAMGTDVFFVKDNDPPKRDPLFEPTCKQMYKYFAKTNRVINFQRMFVESNTEESKETAEPIDEEPKPSTSAAAAAEILKRKEKEKADDDAASEVKTNITYEEAIKLFPGVAEVPWRENPNSSGSS